MFHLSINHTSKLSYPRIPVCCPHVLRHLSSQTGYLTNHDPRPEVRQRATAIHLLHLKHKPATVAEMVAVTQATIYNWWQRWQKGAIEGLANRAKSGRPAKADDNYIALLEQTLEISPLELGFDFPIWTINRLRQYLAEQTNILLSYSRFRALLTKLDYVYRQPKHDLTHLQDSVAR